MHFQWYYLLGDYNGNTISMFFMLKFHFPAEICMCLRTVGRASQIWLRQKTLKLVVQLYAYLGEKIHSHHGKITEYTRIIVTKRIVPRSRSIIHLPKI